MKKLTAREKRIFNYAYACGIVNELKLAGEKIVPLDKLYILCSKAAEKRGRK